MEILLGPIILACFVYGWMSAAKEDKNKWYGHMHCSTCGYQWTSRKNTPPRQCANCRSRDIGVIRGR